MFCFSNIICLYYQDLNNIIGNWCLTVFVILFQNVSFSSNNFIYKLHEAFRQEGTLIFEKICFKSSSCENNTFSLCCIHEIDTSRWIKMKNDLFCLELLLLILCGFDSLSQMLHLVNKIIYLTLHSACYCDKRIMFFFLILHIFRALNEMWKCQNMLRSHVRELLDLHKQPTVRFWKK